MIEAYLHNIAELLSTSAAVSDVEVMRRSIRDTDLKWEHKVGKSRG